MALAVSPPKFSQATIVVGALLFGFVLWLAVNNRLATYWAILIGQGGGQAPNTVVNNPVSTTGQPTTGTATGTVTTIDPLQPSTVAAGGPQTPVGMGF